MVSVADRREREEDRAEVTWLKKILSRSRTSAKADPDCGAGGSLLAKQKQRNVENIYGGRPRTRSAVHSRVNAHVLLHSSYAP